MELCSLWLHCLEVKTLSLLLFPEAMHPHPGRPQRQAAELRANHQTGRPASGLLHHLVCEASQVRPPPPQVESRTRECRRARLPERPGCLGPSEIDSAVTFKVLFASTLVDHSYWDKGCRGFTKAARSWLWYEIVFISCSFLVLPLQSYPSTSYEKVANDCNRQRYFRLF